MPSKPVIEVVGYRWQSSHPHTACDQCARLHGQGFYYHPKGGQNSVSDMPDPPLHPNCRCQVETITRTRVEADYQEGERSFINGGFDALGGRWGSNGRELSDGPVYEKWCGKHWSGGKDIRDTKARGPKDAFPSDDLDAACQGHDDCYDMFEEDYCDRKLVKDLELLPDDPTMWRYPPDNEKTANAKDFRKWAIRWFKFQINMRQNKQRDFPKEFFSSSRGN